MGGTPVKGNMPVTAKSAPLYPADRKSPSRVSSPADIRALKPDLKSFANLRSLATDLENISKTIDALVHSLKNPAPITTDVNLTAAEVGAAGPLTNDTTGNALTATTAGGAPPTGPAGGALGGTYPNPTSVGNAADFSGNIAVRNSAGTGVSTIHVTNGRITGFTP